MTVADSNVPKTTAKVRRWRSKLMMALIMALGLSMGLPYGCDWMAGNRPMVLHGKVVDQAGQPVAGVNVTLPASKSTWAAIVDSGIWCLR